MTKLDVNYVYLIAHGQGGTFCGPVKVGFSRYPDKRLSSLQTGNPHPIGFVFKFKAPSRELAVLAESAFHQIAKGKRISGEWFDMSPELALNTLTKTLIGFIADDVSDPALIVSLCEFSGVWDAVKLWGEMRGDAHV